MLLCAAILGSIGVIAFLLFVPVVFKCAKCEQWIWFKRFEFYGCLSGRTYCKPCYQEHHRKGGNDMDLI